MTRIGIRFRPPEVPISPEVRWVLMRAFGPPDAPFSEKLDPEEGVQLARLLEISPRIAVRQSRSLLVNELGKAWESCLLEDRRRAVFVGLQRVAAARHVAQIAAELETPVVFLKFLALHFSGVIQPGSREAADIDLLVPQDRLEELYDALCRRGYLPRDLSPSEHHLPTLDHAAHGPVEIHRFVPGVAVDTSGTTASVRSLEANHLLSRISDLPGDCRALSLEVQIAHTLVHGIVQHGSHPDAYSSARMIADLVDLSSFTDRPAEAFGKAHEKIQHMVSVEEAAAVRNLCAFLTRGALPWDGVLTRQSSEGVFLRHILAGPTNRDYRNALNLSIFRRGLAERKPAVALWAVIRRAVFPSRGEIDRIYGKPKSSAGYLAKRVLRPMSLLARVFRSWISFLKVRLFGGS